MFREGIIKEIMDRRTYEKPSEARRRRHREAIKRCRREQKIRHDEYGID